jgi:2,3-bisphosphoglycerate-independent phosphoglycerate mutase
MAGDPAATTADAGAILVLWAHRQAQRASVPHTHAIPVEIGLLTEKSSHGSVDYPLALLRMAQASDLSKVYLHVIFDARSTEPGTAPALLELLQSRMEAIGAGRIVSGVGRGIALDRDGDYAKTRRAYDALVFGTGIHCMAE